MRLPEGWKLAKIGEIAKFSSGGTPSKLNDKFWGGVHPWITAKDLKKHYLGNSIDTLTDIGFAKAKIAPVGATLILVRGMTLLKNFPVGYATRPMSFNQDIKALVPLQGTDGLFLSFFLVAQKDKIRQFVSIASHGTGKLDTEIIKGLSIKIPPFPEQQKIAQILSTWDKAIEKLEAVIAAKQKRKKALIQQLLTGKVRFSGLMGMWNWVRFDQILDIEIGGTPSINNPDYWDKEKVSMNRWLSIRDLKGNVIEDTKEYITDLGVKKSNVTLIPAGSIVMSFKLTIGRAAILGKDCYTNEAICSLIPKNLNTVTTEFLIQALDAVDFEKEIDQAIKVKTLNKAKLKRLKINLPLIDEQIKIATVLSTADNEIITHQNQLAALKQQKQGLMQQLLTGKVRVKLKPEGTIQ
jgi:type I restriction enzyme S subunit